VNRSLHSRLLLAASAALLAFLGLAGLALDAAFRNRTEVAVEDRLQGQVRSLLVAADLDEGGSLRMAEEPPEHRFRQIGSGLYARITDAGGRQVWESPSLLDKSLSAGRPLMPGQSSFESVDMPGERPVFLYRFGVAWETMEGGVANFQFSAAEDTRRYDNETGAFRRTLWVWLGGATVVLLVVQVFVLRWSLKPLSQVAAEIDAVERGERDYLESNHPREISKLTNSVNTLLKSERDRQYRYRDNVDDLAHSLKTPLAVLRGWLDSQPDHESSREAEHQIERIGNSVEYHLRRSASGAAIFSRPVPVGPVVSEIVSALHKVYAGRNIETTVRIPDDLAFYGDRGDLMEVFGNVLDNAFKHCSSTVTVEASPTEQLPRPGMHIEVTDDGEGFPDFMGSRVLERGVRADTRHEGHGIGLASTRDIVDVYGGTMEVGNISRGGAIVTITLPSAGLSSPPTQSG